MDERARRDTTTNDDGELMKVLGGQHAHIRDLFAAAQSAPREGRGSAFNELARFLAIHEAVEQEALHVGAAPAPDSDIATPTPTSSAQDVAAQRLREEEAAAKTVTHMETMDASSGSFLIQLQLLEEAVSRHAEMEETEEVPRFVAVASSEELAGVVVALRRVDELAADVSETGAVPVGVGFADQLAATRRALASRADTTLETSAE